MSKNIILTGRVYDGVQQDLDKIIKTTNRELMRLGVTPISLHLGKSWGVLKTIGTPAPRNIRCWSATITGVLPKPKGTLIHGVIETGKSDQPFIRNFLKKQNIPFDDWRESPPPCCECGRSENRGLSYIIQKEGEPSKVIGANCLERTLGFKPDKAFKIMSAYTNLDKEIYQLKGEKGMSSKITDDTYLSLTEFLQHTLCIVDKKGYVSKGDGAMPTGHSAMLSYLNGPQIAFNGPMFQLLWRDYENYLDEFDNNKDQALKMIEWAANLPKERSSYLSNIKSIASDGWVSIKHCNLAASIYHAYESKRYDVQLGTTAPAAFTPEGLHKDTALHLRCARIDEVNTKYGKRFLHKLYSKDGDGYGIFMKDKSMTPGKFYSIVGEVSHSNKSIKNQLSFVRNIKSIESSTLDGPSPSLQRNIDEEVSP